MKSSSNIETLVIFALVLNIICSWLWFDLSLIYSDHRLSAAFSKYYRKLGIVRTAFVQTVHIKNISQWTETDDKLINPSEYGYSMSEKVNQGTQTSLSLIKPRTYHIHINLPLRVPPKV